MSSKCFLFGSNNVRNTQSAETKHSTAESVKSTLICKFMFLFSRAKPEQRNKKFLPVR